MKMSLIIPLLLVLCNFEVHAQNLQFVQTNLDKLELQLSMGFPINTQFNHQDIGNTGNYSLYFRFYYPEFEILGDTVYLSYVEEFKNYSTLPVYSKIEQTFPTSCIDTLEVFAFTYGNDDHFEPSLNYIGIHLKEDCKHANRTVYKIDTIDWNTKQPFQNLKLIYKGKDDFMRFPTRPGLTLFEQQTTSKDSLTPDNEKLVWVNNKIEELNGYLQAAYGNDAPIHFSIEGIYSENVKSIHWSDVKNMSVNRSENKVSISCIDGRDLQFDFNENQYTHIASMHVHFLAFYQKIAETVAENSINRNAINEADLELATQILNDLLPRQNYYVTETGVRAKDFGMVIDFSVNKQLDKPVIIIDADSSKFEMCCFLGTEESGGGTLNDQYYSTAFSFSPNQLDKIKELKGILDKIFKSENK